MTRARPIAAAAVLLSLLLGLAGGCAYYNTFYLAKRYYNRSLVDVPYPVDKSDLGKTQEFNRSIEFSKKVIAQYPKSDWVDDAYLLWARSLIATDDPRQAIKMLEDFDLRFPKSALSGDAKFYLGVANLRARKYEAALRSLDEFLAKSPRHDLQPYAHLERARTLLALERPDEAAKAAGVVVERWSKHLLADRARIVQAQALYAQKSYDAARADYHALGRRAQNDDDRIDYLLSESECLEAATRYDEALTLLQDALAHVKAPPPPPDTGRVRVYTAPTGPGSDYYGRLLVRIGTVHLAAQHLDDALTAWRSVVQMYPRTGLAAEAQYRVAHAYETDADDFDKARAEYGHVKEQGPGTTFADQAATRIENLDRLARFKKSGGDTLDRAIEAGFLLAEQYLFQLDKPERALEEYQKIEQTYPGTPHAAKAINAQAWVLSRKLNRRVEADSLFWKVVREHPGTEAQLAARDYLEGEGFEVPDTLIKLPEAPAPPPDSTAADTGLSLTPPPAGSIPLGTLRLGVHPGSSGIPPIVVPGAVVGGAAVHGLLPDSTAADTTGAAPHDTTHAAPRDTTHTAAPPDTSHAAAPRDTTHHATVPDTSRSSPRAPVKVEK